MNNLYISILEMYLLDIYSSHLNYSCNFNASKVPIQETISKHFTPHTGDSNSKHFILFQVDFKAWQLLLWFSMINILSFGISRLDPGNRKFYSVINDDQTTCSFC